MKKPVLISVIVAVFILGTVIGAFLGFKYSMQFYEDFKEYAVYTRAAANTSFAVGALQRIRDNKTSDAIELLESFLDGELITFMHYDSLSSDKQEANVIRILKNTKQYRERYPHKSSSPDVDETIEKVLSSEFISNGNP